MIEHPAVVERRKELEAGTKDIDARLKELGKEYGGLLAAKQDMEKELYFLNLMEKSLPLFKVGG